MQMQPPSNTELLVIWERGLALHPIDRALLLCARALPDLPVSRLGDLPLGAVNRALLSLREACFGAHFDATCDCEKCGERLEIALDLRQLLAEVSEHAPDEFEVGALRFRAPTSRDLASVARETEADAAAMKLLEKCCLSPLRQPADQLTGLLAEAGAALEAIDPATDIRLAVGCENCRHDWLAEFDIGAVLWDEIDAHARTLLGEVHALAGAYGWSEPEILALSAQRRAAYLDMVGT